MRCSWFSDIRHIDLDSYAQGGSFLEWTGTLDGVLGLDFDTVIPGHGAVSTRDDVVKFRADLQAMRDRVAALIHPDQSRRADPDGRDEGAGRRDVRDRLRLACDGLSAEPAEGRLSAVSADGRADRGVDASDAFGALDRRLAGSFPPGSFRRYR